MEMKPCMGGVVAIGLLLGACLGDNPSSVDGSPDGGADATSPSGDGGSPGDGGNVENPCAVCRLGCGSTAGTCKRALPTTAAASDLPIGTADLKMNAGTIEIDTSTGAIKELASGTVLRSEANPNDSGIGFGTKTQTGSEVELAVFTMRSLSIAKDVTVKVKGPRALVLFVDGDITIDGTLSVRPDCSYRGVSGGPSAPASPLGGSAGQTNTGGSEQPLCMGGGGGGNATAGGAGGAAKHGTRQPSGALGGPARASSLLEQAVLFSGGAGGPGSLQGLSSNFAGTGGKGGGALELVSSGWITVNGTIDAGGCGGFSGRETVAGSCTGGGGGGAGGTVLIEAAAVRVTATGKILANGGGGAGGTNGAGIPDPGQDGSVTDSDAAGGGASRGNCPAGGSGAPGTLAVIGVCDLPLSPSPTQPASSAGGGGASGHIVARTLSGQLEITVPGVVFPAAVLGNVVTQ